MHLTIKERVELVLMSGADGVCCYYLNCFICFGALFMAQNVCYYYLNCFYMLWCVIYGPKRLLLLSELFYMLWCVIYGPPCISSFSSFELPRSSASNRLINCFSLVLDSTKFSFVDSG